MTAVAVAFNVVGNSALCFAATYALVLLACYVLRLGPGRLRLLFWLVPFVKVLWELGRGIPARSFLWVHALGARQDLGSFRLGFGVEAARPPFVRALLSAHSSGVTYSQSAADLLYRALSIKVSPLLPLVLVLVVATVAIVRLARRVASIHSFRRRAGDWMRTATPLARAGVVRIYVSKEYRGAPFAAGVLHPYILFSERSIEVLDEPARAAALQHELSHVERGDPLLITALLLFSDVFWFLPRAGRLLARIFAEIELCADQRAVKRGASPVALADALVSVAEQQLAKPSPALGLSAEKSLLRERVERLCRPPRGVSRLRQVSSLCCAALFISSVLYSVFLGN